MPVLISCVLCLLALPVAQAPTPSALESDPKGWVDLLSATEFQKWTRVAQGAGGKLPKGDVTSPSPWKLDAASQILLCEGDKSGHEMFRYGEEVGDFILHAEWRFTKLEGEPSYNSGIYVRTSADASTWFQAQTGPAGGYIFGAFPVAGKSQRVNLRDKMTENRVTPAGEWNVYEVRGVGKTLTLWVNGAVVIDYTEWEVPRGYVGLEAEGYRIEFRNLKLKKL